MKIKSIEFILENCDSIVVEGKYVGGFVVDDIETSIKRIACNSITKMDVANTVAIELHKGANKKHYEFECSDFDSKTVFQRLCGGDITSIKFDLVQNIDGEQDIEQYKYYVDWVGDSDYINEAQTTYVSECGNLYLAIAKDKSIEDFFDKEQINDKDYMDFTFGMYEVGDNFE